MALREGSWFVGGHYLSIRCWEPNFKSSKANLSSVAVWIRLPELPIEYYDPSALKEIGEAFSPVLRVNAHTATESRGRFAWLCVQVNFNEPIVKLLKMGGIDQTVQYEGISSLCFACGHVGHKAENCHYKINSSAKGDADVAAGKCQDKEKQSMAEDTKDAFGPWVLVARKRQHSRAPTKGESQTSHFGPDDQNPRLNNASNALRHALESNKADRISQERAPKSVSSPDIGPNRGKHINEPSSLKKPMYGGKVIEPRPITSSPKPMKIKKKIQEAVVGKTSPKYLLLFGES